MSRHHHSSRTPPISHAHHIPVAMTTNPAHSSRIIKSSRGGPPTHHSSYIATGNHGNEILVPIRSDPLQNGGTLTGTSNGVAVVTINRSSGDIITGSGNMGGALL